MVLWVSGPLRCLASLELAAAGLSAYVTYRVFAYGESWMEALENTIKFEKGPYRWRR